MFHFSHPLIIFPLLFLLVSSMALGQMGVTIALCERIKNPNIDSCIVECVHVEGKWNVSLAPCI